MVHSFIQRRFIQLLVVLFTTVVLVACGSAPSIPAVGSNISASYIAPEDYASHRSQQRFFTTNAGRIAYTDHGKGPVLVMIHGVPSSSWMYRKMIAPLQESHRVITVDLLGYGSSDKPQIGNKDRNNLISTYGYKSQATYVTELIASLGVNEFSLLFHDMGGLVAWQITQQSIEQSLKNPKEASQRISNLYILNTIISKDGFEHPEMAPGFVSKQLSKSYSNKMTNAFVLEKTFTNMGLSSEHSLTEAECQGYVFPLHEGSDKALYQFYTGFDEQLFSELESNIRALKNYQGNSFVFWGEKDKVLTSRQLETLYSSLNSPVGNRYIYDENGHFLAEEIPEEIVKIIQQTSSQ